MKKILLLLLVLISLNGYSQQSIKDLTIRNTLKVNNDATIDSSLTVGKNITVGDSLKIENTIEITKTTTANSYSNDIASEWSSGAKMASGGSNGIYAISNPVDTLQNAYSLRGRMDLRDATGAVYVNQLHGVDALINLNETQDYFVDDNISVLGGAIHGGTSGAIDGTGSGSLGGATLNIMFGMWGPTTTQNFDVETNFAKFISHAGTYVDYGLNIESSSAMTAGILLNNHASNSPATMTAGVKMISAASKMTYGIDMSEAGITTADILLQNGTLINNKTADSLIITEAIVDIDGILTTEHFKTDTINATTNLNLLVNDVEAMQLTEDTVFIDSTARVSKLKFDDGTEQTTAAIGTITGNNNEILMSDGANGTKTSSNFTWNDTTLIIKDVNNNVLIGDEAAFNRTSGEKNVIIGVSTASVLSSGSNNSILGYRAGIGLTTGGANTFIGYRAGNSNVTGVANVFLGHDAGFSETGSNKLYIENSNSTTPLIYGEFDNDSVIINGDLKVTGTVQSAMLKQTESWDAFGGFENKTETIAITEDVYSQITNAANDLWGGVHSSGITVSGDTIEFANSGTYIGSVSMTWIGDAQDVYIFRVYNVTDTGAEGFSIGQTGLGAGDYQTVTKPLFFYDISANDRVVLQVTNESTGADIVMKYGSFFINYLHD